MDISGILSGNGFELTTTKDHQILSTAITKSFQVEFGPNLGTQIASLISEITNEPWEKILTDFSLLEYSLKKIFQQGSKEILDGIKNEILKHPEMANKSDQSIPIILSSIRLKQVFSTLKNLNKNQHPILLFNTVDFRNKIIQEFFDIEIPNDSKGCFSENPSEYKKNITYDKILEKNQISATKVNQFLNEVHQTNQTHLPSRFACENTIWFKNQGLFDEHQKLGDKLDKKVVSQSCILCCYNVNQLNNSQIQRIIQTRGIIILENPTSIYRRVDS